MNKIFDNKQEFTELYRDAVMSISGKSVEAASDLDRFNALAKLVAEKARTVATKSDARVTAEGKKRVYYFSIEFLIGRLLDNYLLNFGVRDMVAEALDDMGFDLSVIENQEPDPALGNGGLGRLAACFLDSMAAEGIAGYGNGMRYRYGLFKQEIVNGSQVEATDEWLTHGYPWEVRRQDKAVTIKFGGHVEGFEENGRTFYRTVDPQDILAGPYDLPVVGYAGETVNKLRVWAAEPVEEHFDLEAFNRGDYALADAERAEAEAISAILYPNDAGEHGRLLRLKQEYLFVSAGIYSLLDTFEKEHGENWDLLPQFVAIHTNDTHPAMCGPELMRILIDEKKLEWDDHAGGLAGASAPDRHPVGRRDSHGQPVCDLQPQRQRRGQDPLRHHQEHRAQGLLCPDAREVQQQDQRHLAPSLLCRGQPHLCQARDRGHWRWLAEGRL